MLDEAKIGKQHLWVRQGDVHANLANTEAAKQAVKWLEMGLFRVDWKPYRPNPEQLKDGSFELIQFNEMVIMWGADPYEVLAVAELVD